MLRRCVFFFVFFLGGEGVEEVHVLSQGSILMYFEFGGIFGEIIKAFCTTFCSEP